jgi:hypothetical protein
VITVYNHNQDTFVNIYTHLAIFQKTKKEGRKEGEREKEKTIKKKGSEFINAVKKDFLTILAFPLLAQSFQ